MTNTSETPASQKTQTSSETQHIENVPSTEGCKDGHQPSKTNKRRPWYKSEQISGRFFAVTFMLWFTTGAYIAGQLNAMPTRVMLKSEGCAYLHHRQIATQPYDLSGICTVSAPFISHLISGGGVFKLASGDIEIADNQIVAIEEIKDVPFSLAQKLMIAWLCINTTLLIVAMIWALRCL